ncbi:MAG: hypothetical protein PUP91_28920 [Rhizonema sp. PD37]|nr:hypothetical protein [Rhizonema sp. PD37]
MEERPNVGPFDPLLDVQGVKGPQDIFGNISSSSGADNPFSMGSSTTTSSNLAYGGDPFAGENFWNLFEKRS